MITDDVGTQEFPEGPHPDDMVLKALNTKKVSLKELDQLPRHGPDYKRMSRKQRGLLLAMLEFLGDIVENEPAVITDARAHLMIESIEPHYKALKGIMAQCGDDSIDDDDDGGLLNHFDDDAQVMW